MKKTKYKRCHWVIRLLASLSSYGNLMNADGRRMEAPTIQNNLAALMEIIEEQDAFCSMRNSSPSMLSWLEFDTKLAAKSFRTVLSPDGPFYRNEHLKKIKVEKIICKKNSFEFVPMKEVQMIMFLDKQNFIFCGVLIGCVLIDVRLNEPTYVDQDFFSKNRTIMCYKWVFPQTNEEGIMSMKIKLLMTKYSCFSYGVK